MEATITVADGLRVFEIDFDPRNQAQWDTNGKSFMWLNGVLREVRDIHTTAKGIQFELFPF